MADDTKIPLDIDDIFTGKRACEYLEISRMTLWRWTKSGKIKAIFIDSHPIYPLSELIRVKEAKDG